MKKKRNSIKKEIFDNKKIKYKLNCSKKYF